MAFRSHEDCQEMLPPPRRTTLSKIGKYTVTKGGKPEPFWPIDPVLSDQAHFFFLAQADVMPGNTAQDFNTLVLPPGWGVFDIVIHVSDDYTDLAANDIEEDSLKPSYYDFIMRKPSTKEMPLAVDEFGNAHIAFGVYIEPGGEAWEGKLRLEANTKAGGHRRLELPLKVEKLKLVNDLFIFFIPHPTPPLVHAWCKVKVMDATYQPIPDASAKVKVLRNNLQAGFKSINRRVDLYSQDDGYLAAFGTRKVIGLPTGWPLIFNVTKDAYVQRGHMLKLAAADSPNNLKPLDKPDDRTGITMLANDDVDLSDKTILLDPGHGVVYADSGNRRSQEWFSADQMAERVASILTSRFQLPEANILWTRTAGFGLIAPDEITVRTAPENGAGRYTFDLTDPAARKIHARANLPAETLSNLLLTGHADDNSALPAPVSRRNGLIQNNQTTVETATQRLIAGLNLHWRMEPDTFSWQDDGFQFNVQRRGAHPPWVDVGTGRMGWDDTAGQYLFVVEMTDPTAAESAVMANAHSLKINQADSFTLDDEMMRTLEDRSARWSLQCEIGGDADFAKAARKAMRQAGALDYMKRKCRWSNDQLQGSALLAHGTMGWDVVARLNYFNGAGAVADFILTIHENAAGGIGSLIEVAMNATQPVDQLRIAKTFIKYVDPFDQGFSGSGVFTQHGFIRLVDQGAHRSKHVFLELEFMDSKSPRNSSIYQYEEMLDEMYFSTVAEQIAAGIVEWLLLPQDQATFDAIKFNAGTSIW